MRFVCALFICILTISCTKNLETIRDLDVVNGTLENDDIISRIDFVYLKDADGFLISSICGIRYFDDVWYVLDNDKRNAILAFSNRGIPLTKYDKIGRGPGEYINIAAFDINQYTGDVCILCGPPKIVLLDCNLNLKKEIMLDKYYDRVACYKDGFLLFSGQDGIVDYISEDGSKMCIFKTKADYYYVDQHNPIFIRNGDRMFFQTESEDVVYEIVDNKFIEVVEYDYLGRTESQKKHASETIIGMDALEYIRPQILCVTNFENRISFIYRKLIYRFNMEVGDGVYMNMDVSLTGLKSSLTMIDRKLIGWIYSFDYDPLTFNENGLYNNIEVCHIPWNEELKESGNPVLVLYTLK